MQKRLVKILGTGVTNGRSWARGVVDFNDAEKLAALQLAATLHVDQPSAAFGIISGIPAAAIERLNVGDTISASEVAVRVYSGKDSDGNPQINTQIQLSGKATRLDAVPECEVDW